METSIPVDLINPGQVFACLGFLEAAHVLCGGAEGRFDWHDEEKFFLRISGEVNPFEKVLEFLSKVEVRAIAPERWRPKKEPKNEGEHEKLEKELQEQIKSIEFPSTSPDTSSAMPIQIIGQSKKPVTLSHWADGSSRNEFKLYSGNRSALDIAKAMLLGTRGKPRKGHNRGNLVTKGLVQLWEDARVDLVARPLDILSPMGGSFNFDPRGAWTQIDAGYSPNNHKHKVVASPVVEILAAWGLEHTRPDEFETRKVRYSVWAGALPPMLARAALACRIEALLQRRFSFELTMSGKEKIITVAQEET
ncbi:MAG: type I-U CRISPR-associated protein Cas8c [Rhodospirillaceae bacterium]|nr:type I-U CRISPR-associated protein Cas8c [Rhodospirillaceae bacterium]